MTGTRKFKAFVYTLAAGLAVFLATLGLSWATGQPVSTMQEAANGAYLFLAGALGVFSGANTWVHAATKDKTA
jgi:hypothetical protein